MKSSNRISELLAVRLSAFRHVDYIDPFAVDEPQEARN
jgi:hypothetical protein